MKTTGMKSASLSAIALAAALGIGWVALQQEAGAPAAGAQVVAPAAPGPAGHLVTAPPLAGADTWIATSLDATPDEVASLECSVNLSPPYRTTSPSPRLVRLIAITYDVQVSGFRVAQQSVMNEVDAASTKAQVLWMSAELDAALDRLSGVGPRPELGPMGTLRKYGVTVSLAPSLRCWGDAMNESDLVIVPTAEKFLPRGAKAEETESSPR